MPNLEAHITAIHNDFRLEKSTPDRLAFKFRRIAETYLKDHPDEDAQDVVKFLVGQFVEAVPPAAFEDIKPEHLGVLFFHAEVNESSVTEACESLLSMHHSLPAGRNLYIYMSSPGGNIFSGFGLMSTIQDLQRMGRKVHIHITAAGFSMASLILQVADVRTMDSHSYLMLHEMADVVEGSLSKQTNEIEFNRRLEQTCLDIFAARTGKPASYFASKTKDKNWYLSPQEALEEKLIDFIYPPTVYTLPEARPKKKRGPKPKSRKDDDRKQTDSNQTSN